MKSNKTKAGGIKMIEPKEKVLAIIGKVLELNKMIIQQNEMILKGFESPQFIIENEGQVLDKQPTMKEVLCNLDEK